MGKLLFPSWYPRIRYPKRPTPILRFVCDFIGIIPYFLVVCYCAIDPFHSTDGKNTAATLCQCRSSRLRFLDRNLECHAGWQGCTDSN